MLGRRGESISDSSLGRAAILAHTAGVRSNGRSVVTGVNTSAGTREVEVEGSASDVSMSGKKSYIFFFETC